MYFTDDRPIDRPTDRATNQRRKEGSLPVSLPPCLEGKRGERQGIWIDELMYYNLFIYNYSFEDPTDAGQVIIDGQPVGGDGLNEMVEDELLDGKTKKWEKLTSSK